VNEAMPIEPMSKCKLLEKQKQGKTPLRQFGKIDIRKEAFIAALKVDV
jgi:translation elongation factor EF-4